VKTIIRLVVSVWWFPIPPTQWLFDHLANAAHETDADSVRRNGSGEPQPQPDLCPRCQHSWHGLPLTKDRSLRRDYSLGPSDYDDSSDSDSEIICPGAWSK